MKLALGTVQFGLNYGVANARGQVSLDEAGAILRTAAAGGVDTLDTAMAYGDSERRLGEIGVAHWKVVTKLPSIPDDCTDVEAWVTASVQSSLSRLKVGDLYGLLLHRPDQLLSARGAALYRALRQLKADGLIERYGVSIYDPAELDALCVAHQFDLVQVPFNVFDRRLIQSGWLSRLTAQGTQVHVRSVFLQGLLLLPTHARPAEFERWAPLWAAYDRWLQDAGVTPLQGCLRYALSFAGIDRVIVGVDSERHLTEILNAADGAAPEIPDALMTDDPDLLNPARWPLLKRGS